MKVYTTARSFGWL